MCLTQYMHIQWNFNFMLPDLTHFCVVLAICPFEECSLPWWWRQYAPLKRRSTSTRLHGAIFQKTIIFMLATMKTWNITRNARFSSIIRFHNIVSPNLHTIFIALTKETYQLIGFVIHFTEFLIPATEFLLCQQLRMVMSNSSVHTFNWLKPGRIQHVVHPRTMWLH
jgi:hypothetical protein